MSQIVDTPRPMGVTTFHRGKEHPMAIDHSLHPGPCLSRAPPDRKPFQPGRQLTPGRLTYRRRLGRASASSAFQYSIVAEGGGPRDGGLSGAAPERRRPGLVTGPLFSTATDDARLIAPGPAGPHGTCSIPWSAALPGSCSSMSMGACWLRWATTMAEAFCRVVDALGCARQDRHQETPVRPAASRICWPLSRATTAARAGWR